MIEADILKAFDQGRSAARQDKPRAGNPYAPGTQAEQYQAWNAGYDEEEPAYRVIGHQPAITAHVRDTRDDEQYAKVAEWPLPHGIIVHKDGRVEGVPLTKGGWPLNREDTHRV